MNWETARRAALERDEGRCARCSRPASDVHHRVLKGAGGTKSESILYGLSNLVSLCRSCHAHVHGHPAESYESGFLVHGWDDPELIPLPGREVCAPLF